MIRPRQIGTAAHAAGFTERDQIFPRLFEGRSEDVRPVVVVIAIPVPRMGIAGGLMGWRRDIRQRVDGGAVGPCDGAAITIGVIHVVGADVVVVPEAVDFTAFVLEKVFHIIIFVIFGRYSGDRVLDGAG